MPARNLMSIPVWFFHILCWSINSNAIKSYNTMRLRTVKANGDILKRTSTAVSSAISETLDIFFKICFKIKVIA